MSLFNTVSIKCTDRSGTSGSYVNGVWTPVAGAAYYITGSAQPLTSREYNSLPEGRKDTEVIKIYTSSVLKVSTNPTSDGTEIEWNGKKWVITDRFDNLNGVISHYKYLANYTGKI